MACSRNGGEKNVALHVALLMRVWFIGSEEKKTHQSREAIRKLEKET